MFERRIPSLTCHLLRWVKVETLQGSVQEHGNDPIKELGGCEPRFLSNVSEIFPFF